MAQWGPVDIRRPRLTRLPNTTTRSGSASVARRKKMNADTQVPILPAYGEPVKRSPAVIPDSIREKSEPKPPGSLNKMISKMIPAKFKAKLPKMKMKSPARRVSRPKTKTRLKIK